MVVEAAVSAKAAGERVVVLAPVRPRVGEVLFTAIGETTMHHVFRTLQKAAKWSTKHRALTGVIAGSMVAVYCHLSPTEKQRVNAILRRGAVKLAKMAIGDAVHWASEIAVDDGMNPYAVRAVERGMVRVAEIGLDRAIEEIEAA